jgi:hypothetical protein
VYVFRHVYKADQMKPTPRHGGVNSPGEQYPAAVVIEQGKPTVAGKRQFVDVTKNVKVLDAFSVGLG